MQLHFADHVVLVGYLGAMMFLGWRLSRAWSGDSASETC